MPKVGKGMTGARVGGTFIRVLKQDFLWGGNYLVSGLWRWAQEATGDNTIQF